MATKDITITPNDELVVKARTGAAAVAQEATGLAQPGGAPPEVEARAMSFVKALDKRLNDALEALRAGRAAAVQPQVAELKFPPLQWNLATIGPIQLGANPPYDVNKIIQAGEFAAIIGISFANPLTGPPTNMYLAGKQFRARISTVNYSNLPPGSAVTVGPPPAWNLTPNTFNSTFAATDVFRYFVWIFRPTVTPNPALGLEASLHDVNFDIDISQPNVPGAGFATWHYDFDLEPGIPANIGLPGIPATGPGWRHGTSNRFMVNNFPL